MLASLSLACLLGGVAASFVSAPASQPRSAVQSRHAAASMEAVIKIGTRGSPLALEQAYQTKRRLRAAFPDELGDEDAVSINVIKTTGDMVLDKALKDVGGKGLFTKELDVQLLNKDVDICVHSMKDVPTWLVPGTILPCNLEREDTRDAWISPKGATPAEIGAAVIGTASLRRQAQLLAKNPDLKCVNFRGNVQTRLKKLDEGVVDGTLLALAGLSRMNMTQHITTVLSFDEMLPAVAQGAIGIQCREGDERVLRYLDALNHEPTKVCVDCERAFLAALDGNCRTPIAGQAQIVDGTLIFRGLIAKPDGSVIYETRCEGKIEDGVQMGTDAGAELKTKCGSDMDAFYSEESVAPEPESSMSGLATDGLGGYVKSA